MVKTLLKNRECINLYNLFLGLAFAFNKYPRSTIDSLGTPYDYGSVMHYGSFAFSKNKRPTIVAKRQGVLIFLPQV